MAIEDKYLDEGLFSGVKTTINNIKDFFDDLKKFQPQFDAISKTKDYKDQLGDAMKLNLFLEICNGINNQTKSKYLQTMMEVFIKEIQRQQKELES